MPRLPAGPRRRPAARNEWDNQNNQTAVADWAGSAAGRDPAAARRPGHRGLPRLGLLHDPPRRHARGDRRPVRDHGEPPGRGEPAARQRQPDLRRRVAAGAVIEAVGGQPHRHDQAHAPRRGRRQPDQDRQDVRRAPGRHRQGQPAAGVVGRAARRHARRTGDPQGRQLCGAGAARTRSPVAPTRLRSCGPRRATGPSWRTAACQAGPRCER